MFPLNANHTTLLPPLHFSFEMCVMGVSYLTSLNLQTMVRALALFDRLRGDQSLFLHGLASFSYSFWDSVASFSYSFLGFSCFHFLPISGAGALNSLSRNECPQSCMCATVMYEYVAGYALVLASEPIVKNHTHYYWLWKTDRLQHSKVTTVDCTEVERAFLIHFQK